MGESSGALLNQFLVARHILTSISIMGTSVKTPATVAKDEPEARPKSIVEVAIATSKWLEAPIIAAGQHFHKQGLKALPGSNP